MLTLERPNKNQEFYILILTISLKNSYCKGTKHTVEQQFPLEAICMIYRTYKI